MKRSVDKEKRELFTAALQGKNIPILTLDNKWYRLLDEEERKAVRDIEDQMNALLKRQGKLNSEKKELKKLKKKLMGEIVTMVDAAGDHPTGAQTKKIEQHKQKIEESNEKLEEYEDELLDLPKQIDQLNIQLMLATMEFCYADMQENTGQIQEIARWVTKIRIELKKRLIRKQEMEQKNHAMYSYMNDLFGADVMDMFDLEYDPGEQHPVMPKSGAAEKQEPKEKEKKTE